MPTIYDLPRGGEVTTNLANTSNPVSNINDDQPDTEYRSDGAGVLNLDMAFDASTWDTLYFECANVKSYRIWVGDPLVQVAEITQTPWGRNLLRTPFYGDKQWELRTLSPQNEQNLRLQIYERIDANQPVRMWRIWPMRKVLDFGVDDNQQPLGEIDMTFEARTSYIRNLMDGTRERSPLLYGQVKRRVRYLYQAIGKELSDSIYPLIEVFQERPRFVFAQEFNIYPDRVYKAHFAEDRMMGAYLTDFIPAGESLRFTIEEE